MIIYPIISITLSVIALILSVREIASNWVYIHKLEDIERRINELDTRVRYYYGYVHRKQEQKQEQEEK